MKNIIVVGGSSGIGLALVQLLGKENVINISRTPCPVAGVTNITADVTDAGAIKRAFSKIQNADVLVYCAGTSLAAPVECVADSDVKNLTDVNLVGAILCCKHAMPLLNKSENGRIIILSSTGGIVPIPFDSFYSASKSALITLCEGLRLENIKVKSTAAIIDGTRTQFSFKRKIYTDCGDYDQNLKRASDKLIKREQTGYTADFVARKLADIIYASDPPPRVVIGAKNKLAVGLYSVLPKKFRLRLVRKIFDIDKE